MKILFVHQNFPAQFKYLAPALAASSKHEVVALHIEATGLVPNIRLINYKPVKGSTKGIHPWVSDIETKVIRGEAAYNVAKVLKKNGFHPDVIIAHPGWGESLFLKDVWPTARMALYCEFYYRAQGLDLGFDPEFSVPDEDAAARLRVRNAFYELQFPDMDAGLSPTHWQRNSFPERVQSKITVIHDGIDTALVRPHPDVTIQMNTKAGQLTLTRQDEIITFVNRNLEPYRGYHIFMRALPAILKARPNARVLIVGADGVSYGPPPSKSIEKYHAFKNWKEIFIQEVADRVDFTRVHFLGHVAYKDYLAILQLSSVHVYLTYPFVLSWSLMEAMSAGCAIVASNTGPVQEVIAHEETGLLVDFFDAEDLARQVTQLCEAPDRRRSLGEAARKFAIEHYDLQQHCLLKQIEWIECQFAV